MTVRAYLSSTYPYKNLIVKDRHSVLFRGRVYGGLSDRYKELWDREILKVTETTDKLTIQVRIRKSRYIHG